jgi:RNA exonuclease 4
LSQTFAPTPRDAEPAHRAQRAHRRARIMQSPARDETRTYDPYAVSPRVVSIDVECVANGTTHNDRAVAQIAIVDARTEQTLLNVYVKQEKPVVSYLTPLTGLTEQLLAERGVSFAEAVAATKKALDVRCVIVGQGVLKDVEQWLGLVRGVDYGDLIDLCGIWRVFNAQYKSWSVFGQDHLVRCLLATEVAATHDAAGDCVKSVRLYRHWYALKDDDEKLACEKAKLLAIAPEPSFSKRFPSFEGVCQGNRRTCVCKAPFFS